MNLLLTRAALVKLAGAIKLASLDTGKLNLYQNNYTPVPTSVVGDFTVADFAGYAEKTIAAWSAAFVDVNGQVISLAPLETFTCSGGGLTNTIYGAYYKDADGDLMWAIKFDSPIGMAVATDALPFVPRFVYGSIAA